MKGSAFLSLILAALLTAGCSGEKKDQKTPDVVPAENTQRETKTTTTGENDHGARIEFVTREHKMERVLFPAAISAVCLKKARQPSSGKSRKAVKA